MPLSKKYGIFFEDFDTHSAFEFYEAIRHQLPSAQFPQSTRAISNLLEIADEIDVFVFDAFGVLNVGSSPIPGAAECLDALKTLGKQIFILTNSASSPINVNVAKFEKLGFHLAAENIVSSRLAAKQWLEKSPPLLWGVIGREGSDLEEFGENTILLDNSPEDFAKVGGFLVVAGSQWSEQKQLILNATLSANPRPVVIANPDVIAPLENRFSTNPGFIGHRLLAAKQAPVTFHGKPFPSVFEILESRLGSSQPRNRIAMVGDTLHTDIIGGASRGWSTVLVESHGVYRGHPVEQFIERSGIVPTFRVPSI